VRAEIDSHFLEHRQKSGYFCSPRGLVRAFVFDHNGFGRNDLSILLVFRVTWDESG